MKKGRVYWITGLSGVGKTTIARELYESIRQKNPQVVFLDGDELRAAFGNDLGHTKAERMKSAMRNARLCKLLSDQGIDVVCATISLFHDCQKWNREHIAQYTEVFVEAPMALLEKRDPKGIYAADANIAGVHWEAEKPVSPDVHIVNDGSKSPTELIDQILQP